MKPLRNESPRPSTRTRGPSYPRVLELGALLLVGACSRESTTIAREEPTVRPSGSSAVAFDNAPVPVEESAEAGTDAALEAGADAGKADAARSKPKLPPPPPPPGAAPPPYRTPNN